LEQSGSQAGILRRGVALVHFMIALVSILSAHAIQVNFNSSNAENGTFRVFER
jgi:hypothetical protein